MAQSISNALGQNYKKDLFSKPVAPAWKNALKGYTVENKYELKPPQSPAQMPRTTSTSVVPSAGQAPAANTRQQQISNIESQAQNIQGLLNQRKTAETKTKNKPLVQTKPVEETTNFQSVIKGLIDASKGSKEQKEYLEALKKTAEGNRAIGQDAAALSKQYGSEIARVGGLGAGAVAGNLSRGTSVVGSGNAAIASQSASARISALAQGQSAALQGTQQQLTGQGQMASAYGQALSGANVQQQQQISGLNAAGGLVAPNPAAYGQTVFNPLTGNYTDGGNMNPQVQSQSLAQAVMSGQMTYEQALASMGYAGGAGTTFLNNALTAMGGNPLQLQAQGSAQQSNISTSGTAQTQIAREGLGGAVQQYIQLTNYAQAAKQQANDLLNIMNTANVNNVPLIRANKTINTIANEVSDPNIKAFQTALVEAQSLYAKLLSTGGSTPTENDARALIALDGNSTPQATAAAIQQLENSVRNILTAQQNAVQTYQSNLGGGGGSFTGGGLTWDNI